MSLFIKVPILLTRSRMRLNKSLIELFSLLWILLLYQIPETSSASLSNYSLQSVNFSVIQSDVSAPKNLSELIEFSPLNLPVVELENATDIMHQGMKEPPKILSLKLKTRVIVQNQGGVDQSVHEESGEMMKVVTPNASESSLSDIEYLDSSDDFEFWKWKSNSRSRRMKYFDEKPTASSNNESEAENSSEEEEEEDDPKSIRTDNDAEDSRENQISKEVHRSKYASGRQFVFHPYLPYGKEPPPDEKISFDDILPVKMVKFIKSMVEEAPWEQMFMKMVRMIVDQFVDKIIEKMFAHKEDDHLRKRSFDVLLTPTLVLPTFQTPVVRLKRAVNVNTSPKQEEDMFSFLSSKRMEQDTTDEGKKSAADRMSWLDRLLDFVFPNSKSDMSEEEESFDRLKKRDTTNTQFLKTFLAFFLNTFEKSSHYIADAKDVLRYKMLKEFLPFLYQKRYLVGNSDGSSNYADRMKMTHRKLSDGVLKRNDVLDSTLRRSKRSTRGHFRKDEDRLWQAHSRSHRIQKYRSHDECSLRKACNAGRLLSRLPSVQEITLQLRSNGNEPHWDALLWGMKKKRCSRIFCKRQRSPKGSRFSWDGEKARHSKKDEIVTDPPDTDIEQSNNLTIF